MKKGWERKMLGDTCEMYQPKTISGKDMDENGAYLVFGANGVIGRYHKFNHEEPQLLITCRGATCGSVNVSESKSWITGNAMVVRSRDGSIDRRFLEYLFRGGIDVSKAITGAAQPQITRTNLEPLEISFPPPPEQRRIVSILDEAFAGLATAKANAEKNLHNASASGVKVRHTSPTKIGDVVVSFPTSITEQKAIVGVLANLKEQTTRLAAIYQQKLAALEALKKSLLHQAFSGEL